MMNFKPIKAAIAAQQFLDEYVDALKRYEKEGRNLRALATLAGVSGATVSDHKNGKKVENPSFRMVFQVAYALLGKPSYTMTVKPKEIAAVKVQQAMDIDHYSLIRKLAEIIPKITDEEDLKLIEAPIIFLYKKFFPSASANSDTAI